VGAIVDALRAWPGDPVRVTVAEVARHLPPWSKLVQRYRRYPSTREVLLAYRRSIFSVYAPFALATSVFARMM
jgi:hypothetical protein